MSGQHSRSPAKLRAEFSYLQAEARGINWLTGKDIAQDWMERFNVFLDQLASHIGEETTPDRLDITEVPTPDGHLGQPWERRLRVVIGQAAGAVKLLPELPAGSVTSNEVDTIGPRPSPVGDMHGLVWRSAAAQWTNGHRHEAVLAAAKAVNSLLQTKLGRRDVSEMKLIREAFSEKPPAPGRPRLRFPKITDERTRESMRQGVMEFGAGCFQAIRNPIGHLPNDEVELTEQDALERLAALSLLARWIEQAQLVAVQPVP